MSYRDKMIILIISIIIILVAGFFALIRPTYDTLVTDTSTYESTKTEWDGIKQKLDAIPTLKETITTAYNDANKDASIFVNDAFGDYKDSLQTEHVSYLVDKYIQPAVDTSQLVVAEMAIGTAGSTNMEYYYYTPNVLTYALIEAADINGNYAQKASDALATSTLIEERQAAELLATNIDLSVAGQRENLMAFLDAIKADKNAILVDKVSISDYTFTTGTETEEAAAPAAPAEPQLDEEGNPIPTEAPAAAPAAGETVAPGEGVSAMEVNIMFYAAKEIDKPDFGD
jgi:hypothetical protein